MTELSLNDLYTFLLNCANKCQKKGIYSIELSYNLYIIFSELQRMIKNNDFLKDLKKIRILFDAIALGQQHGVYTLEEASTLFNIITRINENMVKKVNQNIS